MKVFRHLFGIHTWYHSKDSKSRSCPYCGAVQKRADLNKKWKNQ